MEAQTIRMTQRDTKPDESQVQAWMGDESYHYWQELRQWIEQTYPGVFAPEWLFGGKKHGWALRYKKSKSFCSLVPEQGRCALMIIFGAKEREKVEAIRR